MHMHINNHLASTWYMYIETLTYFITFRSIILLLVIFIFVIMTPQRWPDIQVAHGIKRDGGAKHTGPEVARSRGEEPRWVFE